MELKEFDKNIKPKKTYKQQWSSYNLAQTNEFKLFQDSLIELIDSTIQVRSPVFQKGRPTADLKDIIFCCVMKVYFGKSSRRNVGYLSLAKGMNYITKVPHFNTILNYYNNSALTPLLKHLVEQSAIPLKDAELDFTADSSGFSTCIFSRWFNARLGKETERRLFRKAHLTSGVKTNIITAVSITDGYCADSPEFEALIQTTAKHFGIREVSADAGYLSRKNFNIVSSVGAIPYIMFKKNSTPRARGSVVYSRMFELYTKYNKMFLEHYHKRSNAESVFHMIKRKFGLYLFCKSEIGQTNELLCKCIAHNLCVLIQELFEANTLLDFEECDKLVVRHFCAN
ncbi:MAG: transposase [Candidatus Nanoarchaeia archaeon]|nr:transposase [Candidatus Nanoarchaeia archaeon]